MSTQRACHMSLILLVLAATGYLVATIGTVFASAGVVYLAVSLIVAGLICTALAEVSKLRRANLLIVCLAVLAFESILALGCAAVLGDRLNMYQLAGALLGFSGIAMIPLLNREHTLP